VKRVEIVTEETEMIRRKEWDWNERIKIIRFEKTNSDREKRK